MTPKVNIAIPTDERIPSSELPRIDAEWGDIEKCECLANDCIENYDPCVPTKMCARIKASYANGRTLDFTTRTCSVLFWGRIELLVPNSESDEWGCISNRRLLAALARAASRLEAIPVGEVKLPSAAESDTIMAELAVPAEPVYDRPDIGEAWYDVWKKSGKLCKMTDGQWVIEDKILPEFSKYKVSHFVDGVERCYPGATEYVELCDGTVKRTEDLTEEERQFIADPAESEINAGLVDGKAAYEAQRKNG